MPSTSTPGDTLVIVLDTTASMGATDVAPNRFEVARKEALDAINRLPSSGEVMILNAGPRPTVALSFTRDKAKARTALEKLEVTEAEGSLKRACAWQVASVKTGLTQTSCALRMAAASPLTTLT